MNVNITSPDVGGDGVLLAYIQLKVHGASVVTPQLTKTQLAPGRRHSKRGTLQPPAERLFVYGAAQRARRRRHSERGTDSVDTANVDRSK